MIQTNSAFSFSVSLGKGEGLLTVPVLAGGRDGKSGVGVEQGLLGEGQWLLSVPVLSSRGDGEAGIWVEKRLLGQSEWLLSIPVLSGSGNSQTSVGVDEWLGVTHGLLTHQNDSECRCNFHFL